MENISLGIKVEKFNQEKTLICKSKQLFDLIIVKKSRGILNISDLILI